MMKHFYIISLFAFLLFSRTPVYSAAVYGNEIGWKCLGKDSFLISYVGYYECNYSVPNVVVLNITPDSSTTLISSQYLNALSQTDITPTCATTASRCKSPSSSFPYGYTKITFMAVINLRSAGSVCRLNLNVPENSWSPRVTTGLAAANVYNFAILNRCLSPCDNSPVFKADPINFLCLGQDNFLNFSCYDPDTNSLGGHLDSLTYEIDTIYGSRGTRLSYTSPYNFDIPFYFYGFPNKSLSPPRGFVLDPLTGILTFRAMKVESSVIAVRINEYRNGVKTGTIRRQLAIDINNCPSNKRPIIMPSSLNKDWCAGIDDSIVIRAEDPDISDSVKLSFFNDIPGSTVKIYNSNTQSPYLVFKWKPDSSKIGYKKFYFYVTAKDNKCPTPLSSTSIVQIRVLPRYSAKVSVTDVGCNNYFFNEIPDKPGSTPVWTGSGGLYSTSSSFYYHYKRPGIYTFSLGLSGCSNIFKDIIRTNNFLYVSLPADTGVCDGSAAFIRSSVFNASGNLRYHWSTGDTVNSSITTGKLHATTLIRLTVNDSNNCPYSDSMKILVNPSPGVEAGQDTSICNGNFIIRTGKFSLQPKRTVAETKWFSGNLSNLVSSTTDLTTSLAGKYYFHVKDNIGCSATDSFSLHSGSPSKVTAGRDTIICSINGLIPLKGIPDSNTGVWWGSGIKHYLSPSRWYFDPNAPGIADMGTYPLIYYYRNRYNCTSGDTMNITVYKAVQLQGMWVGKKCLNSPAIRLHANVTGCFWTGPGVTGKDSFSPKIAGPGRHKLVCHFIHLCEYTDTLEVEVLPLQKLHLSTQDGKTEFPCSAGDVPLLASPAGGFWTGPGISGSTFNTRVGKGIFTVTYTYKDTNWCTISGNMDLKVYPNSVKITDSNVFVCEGQKITLHAGTNSTAGLYWYTDYPSDAIIRNDTSVAPVFIAGHQDAIAGNLRIFVRTNDLICSDKDTLDVSVYAKPETDFEASPLSGDKPLLVNFTNKSSIIHGKISSFMWHFGDGDSSAAKVPAHYYKNTGKFTISLFSVSDKGCRSYLEKKDYIMVTGLGINEAEGSEKIFVIPNPSFQSILVKTDNPAWFIETVKLYNSEGKEIYESGYLHTREVKIEHQPKGTYLAEILISGQKRLYKKIVFE